MVTGRVLLSLVIVAVWHQASCASLPPSLFLNRGPVLLFPDEGVSRHLGDADKTAPAAMGRERVREGVPAPLCAVHCASPRAGPVCAFDAAGTARTFATLCELEAVSCQESTFYAITSLGEC